MARTDRPATRKLISWALRIGVAAAGVAYILYTVKWQDQLDADGNLIAKGFFTTIGDAKWTIIAGGFGVALLLPPLQTTRWLILLRCRGIDVTWLRAFRLTMVGLFFNFCMPLMTGGDVVKAYYAAKRSDRRADAVMSVILDRVLGLVGMMLLAGFVGLTVIDDPAARRVTIGVWTLIGIVTFCAIVYFSKAAHAALRIDSWMHKLPGHRMIKAVDDAAVAYGGHRAAVGSAIGLSVVSHIIIATSTAMIGYALGIDVPFLIMLTVIPMIHMSAIVPSYQGVGVMEATAVALFGSAHAVTENQIVGMLMLWRMYMLVFGVVGSVFVVQGDIHMHPAVDEELVEGV